MTYSKIFPKQFAPKQIIGKISSAITDLYRLDRKEYNSSFFFDLAIGFKILIFSMEEEMPAAFPLFLKWLKMYVAIQHQIDPHDEKLLRKFESKIPVCTSYIMASLQYETRISNYHLKILQSCLKMFNSASSKVLEDVANLIIDVVDLLWTPIEFVGDYNTQKLSLRLIVKLLEYVRKSDRSMKVAKIKTTPEIRSLLLKLAADSFDFEKISRELLNKYNMETSKNCAVFSVYCKTVSLGNIKIFKSKKNQKFWIDFNYKSKSVSFICSLRENFEDEQEVQIRINKLEIDKRFNCVVYSALPFTFSSNVTVELKEARIAVFALPQNEFYRLKRNRDLLDFYQATDDYSDDSESESDAAPATPATIENFLAEESPKDDVSLCLEPLGELEPSSHVVSGQKTLQRSKSSEEPITVARETVALTNCPVADQSNKEDCYNSCVSTVYEDSTIFKRPSQPVRRNKKQKSAKHLESIAKSSQTNESFPDLNNQTAQNPPHPATSTSLENKTPRKFFKTKPIQTDQQTDVAIANKSKNVRKRATKRKRISFDGKRTSIELNKTQDPHHNLQQDPHFNLSSQTKKTNPIKPRQSRKRLSEVQAESEAKRLRVNTTKPLNELAKPDCDLLEATVEYIENGGYINIKNFVQSNAGEQSFSEDQRKQILYNLDKISNHGPRFMPNNIDSNSEVSSVNMPTTKSKKRNLSEKPNFVPYAIWKQKQIAKSNDKSTTLSPKETDQEIHELIPTKPSVSLNEAVQENDTFGQRKRNSLAKQKNKILTQIPKQHSDLPDEQNVYSLRKQSRHIKSNSKSKHIIKQPAQVNGCISENQVNRGQTLASTFDQLKNICEHDGTAKSRPIISEDVPNQNTTKLPVLASPSHLPPSTRSSSYTSNHNYCIRNSDDEYIEATPDERVMPLDMVCRTAVKPNEESPIRLPIPFKESQTNSIYLTPKKVGQQLLEIAEEMSSVHLSCYQKSEVFGEEVVDGDHPITVNDSASEKTEHSPIHTQTINHSQPRHSSYRTKKSLSKHSAIFNPLLEPNPNQLHCKDWLLRRFIIDQSQEIEEPESDSQNVVHSISEKTENISKPDGGSIAVNPPNPEAEEEDAINLFQTVPPKDKYDLNQNQTPTSSNLNRFIRQELNEQLTLSSNNSIENNSLSNVNQIASHPQKITTNQVIIQNQFIIPTTTNYLKYSRSSNFDNEDYETLNGFSQLLPMYIERVSTEKNRLLNQLEEQLERNMFSDLNQIANDLSILLKEQESVNNETQQRLAHCSGNIESLVEFQQAKKTYLENKYSEMLGRIKAFHAAEGNDIDRLYQEMEENLQRFAYQASTELWESFAGGVVKSITDRMSGLVEF